ESIAIRESYLQAATFVGRQAEKDRLSKALEQAKSDSGSAWLVSGESGVGKTRLLDEIGTQALVQGAIVLRGQGIEDVGGSPLQLWREALRRLIFTAPLDDLAIAVLQALIPDIERLLGCQVPPAPELNGVAARQRLISTITTLFSGQSQWVLLILEDLHWVEQGLEILQQLTRLAPRLPLLIIGSYRSDEESSSVEQLSMMEEISLNRLSFAEIEALSTSMLGQVGEKPEVLALLQRETEGNAFFLVEVVRALAQEAGRLSAIGQTPLPQQLFPQGIQTIVQRRLARVPQGAVPLLAGMAVAGQQLDLNLLPLLADTTNTTMLMETWLATCAETAVLELFNGNWRFAHDKLRAGILDSMPTSTREVWHQTIAQHTEQVYPDDPEQAATLVYHWHEFGDFAKECHYARIAGEYAQQQFLNEAALDYFSRALELTPIDDLLTQFELHMAREQIYHLQGKREEQQVALSTLGQIAADLAAQQGVDKRTEVSLRLANYAEATGDYPAAIAAANQARRVAQGSNDKQNEAASYLAAGITLLRQGNYEEAQSSLQKSLQTARTHTFASLEADSLRWLGVTAFDTGQLEIASQYYAQSLPLYERSKNKQGESAVYNNLSAIAFSQGNKASLAGLSKTDQVFGVAGGVGFAGVEPT
ncbi:hypothetical protein MNBD_CHLOROFLEXI01-4828, partial [hydrothermal vent metagenome]